MIEVDISHRLGTFQLEASFAVESGVVALFGRSGSGKSTLVNIISGLIRPDRGRVVVGGDVLADTGRGVFLPPHRRRIGYVFQEGRLFPHMTVRQNLVFGSWFNAREQPTGELSRIVDLLGISHLLARRPGTLSGGEKQRVAIGRALLSCPRLLLMDEPLASLDETRKQEIMPYLERLRDEARVPIIYVSHAVAEVIRLASSTVLLADGRVLASGSTLDLLQRLDLQPATGGDDAGAVIDVQIDGHDETYGLTTLKSRAGLWRVSRLAAATGTKLKMRIQARDVMIALRRPDHVSALNIVEAIITEIGPKFGPAVDVKLDANGDVIVARLTRYSVDSLDLRAGSRVFAIIKAVTLGARG